jgi:hypothetical protein
VTPPRVGRDSVGGGGCRDQQFEEGKGKYHSNGEEGIRLCRSSSG